MTGPTVHFLVPDGIDDAERVSGGNVYDRRIADGLRARGLHVRMVPVPEARTAEVAGALSNVPDDGVVLIDGLIAVPASAALSANAARLRIVVLAHMVASTLSEAHNGTRSTEGEREALHAARAVITTSDWTRSALIARALAAPDRIAVARPGTDPVPAAPGSETGARLLTVGAVAPHKGQDVLVDALAGMTDLPDWTCWVVGSLDADPDFALQTREAIRSAALAERVALTGVLSGPLLEDAYRSADLVVAPSRSESYGMVVAEALARGIPVVASCVGGVPEAIAGSPAGVLVPSGDPGALRAVLRRWRGDAGWRAAFKAEAMDSRTTRPSWEEPVGIIAEVLGEVGARADALGRERRAAG
ncbi:glycosyltransferase involved in cell wall biosynthesis [Agromyces flavus]|uniref:D-inositol 3-phosphate glycosyltransferase n=1 Tax=Agromyces flavus TaxID=589382 RepID=A0A1H1SLH9_9MICO|nr:glycosyltransferase family 4 protein [Agromyces flavus]MCP2369045.1 glycosyltransferase involved in cell wall biosynthesis [Agromyces flavus]GGI48500.1 glycosyl transferase [Agromyces flavus]SDS48874.1 Glycosyl transferases group 1 [Agromyces flavus]